MTRTFHLITAAALLLSLGACSANPSDSARDDSSPTGPTASQSTATGSPAASGPASDSASPTPTSSPSPTPVTKELPRGGTKVFPTHRLFGWSGHPWAAGQGRLGIGKLSIQSAKMVKSAQWYSKGRKVLPVMELIATTVHGSPGADGTYRTRTTDAIITEWLAMARKRKALLLLNIQPGRADFIDELKYFEKYLKEPDVGVALDPEWAIDKGQIPGQVFGNTTGKELDECAAWLSALVAKHHLPEKVMVYHQLHATVVRGESALRPHEGVAIVKSVDGIGSPAAKIDTYNRVNKTTPKHVHAGFKLFFQEDVSASGKLMKPSQVLALKPRPEYVLYE